MKKIVIILVALLALAINSNAQSIQSGYKGYIDAGYSIGIGDYDFGRFEVNTASLAREITATCKSPDGGGRFTYQRFS